MSGILLVPSVLKSDKKEDCASQNCLEINACKCHETPIRRDYWREKMIWWIKRVQPLVRRNVVASAAKLVSLNWTYQIVGWWKRIRVINQSLKFPSSSSALNALLACSVPIGFSEINSHIRCYLMWVSETEKKLEIIQQHFYRQPLLQRYGLTKCWTSLPSKVIPVALRCYLDNC